jgi:hypothetical protein
MTTQLMPVQAPAIYPLLIIFKLNHRLFINALDGLTEEQAKHRISEHNNSIIWVATHTVWSRYNTCVFLGKPATENPYGGMFENFRPFDNTMIFPTLEQVKAEWNKVSGLLKDALHTVTEAHLAADSPLKSPIGDFTNAGTITFLAQHESYDIGQIAFLKKYHTKEAMKY